MRILDNGGVYYGKKGKLENILRIAAAALAVACIWAVTDKLFSAANETERILERIEILPAGSVAENKDGTILAGYRTEL